MKDLKKKNLRLKRKNKSQRNLIFIFIDYRWEMIIMNFNIKILKKNRFEF